MEFEMNARIYSDLATSLDFYRNGGGTEIDNLL